MLATPITFSNMISPNCTCKIIEVQNCPTVCFSVEYQIAKAMKSSQLLGPIGDFKFCIFSLLKIKREVAQYSDNSIKNTVLMPFWQYQLCTAELVFLIELSEYDLKLFKYTTVFYCELCTIVYYLSRYLNFSTSQLT